MDEAVMAEKRARLEEAKKELENAKLLENSAAVEEAKCAAEIDEEQPTLRTANFRPSQVCIPIILLASLCSASQSNLLWIA